MQYYQDPMMFNPYADMMGGGYGYDPSQQEEFARMLAEQQRQQQEQEQQNQSMSQDFGDQLSDYMNGQQAANPSAYSQMAGPEAFQIAGAQGAPASTGVSTLSGAPITMTAPGLGSAGTIGGATAPSAATGVTSMTGAPITLSAAGQAGMAPASAFTLGGAGGATGGATVAGTTAAGTAAAPAAAAAAPSAAAAGGAGAGAAGSAGAGAAMAAAAPWLAIPAAAIGSMQWTNNTNDDVSWGDWVTNPGNAHDALGGNIDDISTRVLGDNMLGGHVGDFLGAPADVLFPSSPGDWFEGVGDALLLNQSADVLKEAGSWIGDLFGGLF